MCAEAESCFIYFSLQGTLHYQDRMGPVRKQKNPLQGVVHWVKKQPPKIKVALGVAAGILSLILLRLVVQDHDNLFVAAESVHAIGILVLIYKFTKEKTCAGLPSSYSL